MTQWTPRKEQRNEGRGNTAHIAITLALSLSLSMGFVDIIRSLLPGPSGLSSFPMILAPLAASVGVFLLVCLALWSLVATHVERLFKLVPIQFAFSLGAFLGVVFMIETSGIEWRPARDQLFQPSLSPIEFFKILIVVAFASLLSLGAYFAAGALVHMSSCRNAARTFSLAMPLGLAETLALVWLYKYKLGSRFLAPSLLVTVGYVFLVLFTAALIYGVSRKVRPVKPLAAFAGLVMLSPMAVVFTAKIPMTSLERFVGTDHRIKHVILITVDTLRADALSCYGQQRISTPHMDRLAENGILFQEAISTAPWTLPSLASIMTGHPPQVHVTIKPGSRLPDTLRTLAEHMRDAGYLTAALGSNPWLEPSNMSRGFLGHSFYPKRIGYSYGSRLLETLFSNRVGTISTASLTQSVITWVESNYERDFFLWIHYLDPHGPYQPPANYLPAQETPSAVGTSAPIVRASARALYDAEVRYVDDSIGMFFEALEDLSLYDESLIILTSDHGEEFGEHGGSSHGSTLYHEVVRVPLLIKLPFASSRRKVTNAVSTQRIMPTILDLCGVSLEGDYLPARSLGPLWDSDSDSSEEEPIVSTGVIYRGNPWSEVYDERVSVVFDGLEYILSLATNEEELYDLTRDPTEKISLVGSLPDEVEKARNALAEHSKMARSLREHHGITTGQQVELDEETIRRLNALGYIQ